jgi:hypothetical protein
MPHTTPTAFGLYRSTRALHGGADALRSARFRQTDISVMYSDGVQALRLRETREESGVADDEDEGEPIGALLSGLSGIGAISMHDAGPYVCGGPVLATLVSHGSGLLATLRSLGIPDTAVERFGARLRDGGLLLSVQCEDDEWVAKAQQILEETGAEQIAAVVAPVQPYGLRAAS